MASIGKIFLIGVLAWFYGCVVYLIFHPDVCKEYRDFYIERTMNIYPGKTRFPPIGRFSWQWGYVIGPRKCFSGKNIRVFPEKIDSYMKKML